jgi:hypothetical protein
MQERHNINRSIEKMNELHFKVENELIQLIKSIQKKQKEGNWEDTF